jgi:phosphate/sulfate permease
MSQILILYVIFAIVGLTMAIITLPSVLSRQINKKNEEKVRELEALLKQKNQVSA